MEDPIVTARIEGGQVYLTVRCSCGEKIVLEEPFRWEAPISSLVTDPHGPHPMPWGDGVEMTRDIERAIEAAEMGDCNPSGER